VKTKLLNVLKVVVSVALLAYVLLVVVDLGDLADAVSEARWGYLILAAVIAVGGVALRAVRWRALLRALEVDVPLARLVKLYYVGSFFNIFLLSGIGGDAIRTIELARGSEKAPEVAGSVLVDRATGLWMLCLMGLAGLPSAAGRLNPGTTVLIGVAAAAVVLGGWVALGTRLIPWLGSRVKLPGQHKLERFYRAVSGCGYRALGQACGISLVFSLTDITVRYLIALGLNVDLPFGVYVTFAPILSISLMLPSVGGLGVREGVHMLMYRTVHLSDAVATAMGLLTGALNTVVPGLIGGLLYAVEGAVGMRNQGGT